MTHNRSLEDLQTWCVLPMNAPLSLRERARG
jgi:hypothetical protein